jgi:hypothetical protein
VGGGGGEGEGEGGARGLPMRTSAAAARAQKPPTVKALNRDQAAGSARGDRHKRCAVSFSLFQKYIIFCARVDVPPRRLLDERI